jgi:hypothetical protein
MSEKYMIKENPFIEMLGLYTVPVTSKEGYNGLVFNGDSLVGYTKKSEDDTIITIEQDDANIWMKDSNNGCYEGYIEIRKKKKTTRIDYIYLEEQKLTSLTNSKQESLELSLESIIAGDKCYKLQGEDRISDLSLEDLNEIKNTINYFYVLMPLLFTNIMKQYRNIFGEAILTYKSKRKQPK